MGGLNFRIWLAGRQVLRGLTCTSSEKCTGVLDLVTFSDLKKKERVPIIRSKDDLLFGNRVEIRNNRIYIKPNAIRICSINGQFYDEIEGLVLSFDM